MCHSRALSLVLAYSLFFCRQELFVPAGISKLPDRKQSYLMAKRATQAAAAARVTVVAAYTGVLHTSTPISIKCTL